METRVIKKKKSKKYLLLNENVVTRTTLWRWKRRHAQFSAMLATPDLESSMINGRQLASDHNKEHNENIVVGNKDESENNAGIIENKADSEKNADFDYNAELDNDDEPDKHNNINEDDNEFYDNNNDNQEDNFNTIMFNDAGLTKKDVITMIYALSIRHGFSREARQDIIELLKLCANLSHDSCSYSDHVISKQFNPSDESLKYIFYCKSCKATVLETTKSEFKNCSIKCRNSRCNEEQNITLSSENLFIILDTSDQFGAILSKTFNELRTKKICTDGDGVISDIYDGDIYQQRKLESHAHSELTYNFNTDGAPIFHSSKTTMWPIQIIINELPPHLRFKYLILAGIWIGKQEPNNQMMNTIIMNFGKEVKRLLTKGVTIKNPNNGQTVNFKMVPLLCCVDSVARPVLQNRLQFNGYYGCSWCYHSGVPVNKQIKYLTSEELVLNRSHESHLTDLEEVVQSNYERTVRGVKGPSALLTLPKFDIVWGLPPDYMHGVLLGVVRQMWDLWTTYTIENRHKYYLGNPNTLAQINSRLLSIKPPQEIHRLPRSLGEKAKWKASEWRSFLLYYSIPCLNGILKHKYFKHYLLLVQSVFILLKTRITQEDLYCAEKNLKMFVSKFEQFYGESAMTFNVHSLLHLTESVKKTGPLWCSSTFPFESGIFKIKRQVKGPVGITKQICKKICITNTFINQTNNNTSLHNYTKLFVNNLFSNKKIKHVHEYENCTFLGLGTLIQNQDYLNKILELQNARDYDAHINLFCYNKCVYKNRIFHSIEYTKTKKTNDTIVNTKAGFVKILQFLSCELGNYIYVEKLLTQNYIYEDCTFQHIFKVTSENGEQIMLSLSDIQEKCIYVKVNDMKTYICQFPNTIEIQ